MASPREAPGHATAPVLVGPGGDYRRPWPPPPEQAPEEASAPAGEPEPAPQPQRYATVADLAEILAVSQATIRRLIRENAFPHAILVRGVYRVPQHDIASFVHRNLASCQE